MKRILTIIMLTLLIFTCCSCDSNASVEKEKEEVIAALKKHNYGLFGIYYDVKEETDNSSYEMTFYYYSSLDRFEIEYLGDEVEGGANIHYSVTIEWYWGDFEYANINLERRYSSSKNDVNNGTISFDVKQFHFDDNYPQIVIDEYEISSNTSGVTNTDYVLSKIKKPLSLLLGFADEFVTNNTKKKVHIK